jgi:hypothetical protein
LEDDAFSAALLHPVPPRVGRKGKQNAHDDYRTFDDDSKPR